MFNSAMFKYIIYSRWVPPNKALQRDNQIVGITIDLKIYIMNTFTVLPEKGKREK